MGLCRQWWFPRVCPVKCVQWAMPCMRAPGGVFGAHQLETVKMGVISAYIVNKAGGLIFSHDQPTNSAEVEVTFNYPLSIVLEEVDRYLVVKYGEKLGIQGWGTWQQ